jgi:hypothetical protein
MYKDEGVYQVVPENLDTTKMNVEKEKYLKFLNLYKNICYNLYISVDTLKELNININTKALNITSPAFLSMSIKNIWLTTIINLCSFFSSDKMSLYKFFDYIKGNYNKIFTGKFRERVVNFYGEGKDNIREIKFEKNILEIVKDCENLILENKQDIDNIKILRKKIFAHFSDDREDYTNILKQINIDVLLKIVKLIETVINKINIQYDRVHHSLKPSNSSDISATISALNTYNTYRKELFDLKYRNATIVKK